MNRERDGEINRWRAGEMDGETEERWMDEEMAK